MGLRPTDVKCYRAIRTVATTLSAPTVQTRLTGVGSAIVTWSQVSGATGYYVQYRASKTSAYTTAAVLTGATAQTYTLSGLVPAGTTIYVRVVAYYDNLDTGVRVMGSRPADVKCSRAARTVARVLSAPTVRTRLTGVGSAIVTWSQVSGATGYYVQYRTSKTSAYITAAMLNGATTQTYTLSAVCLGNDDLRACGRLL